MDLLLGVLALILLGAVTIVLIVFAAVTFFGVKVARTGQRKLSGHQQTRAVVARVERCADAGELRGHLEALSADGRGAEVITCLQRGLPAWPVREPFLAAARELVALRQALPRATAAGVAPGVTGRLGEEVDGAAGLLWRQAERLAAAASILPGSAATPPASLAASLEADRIQLVALEAALHDARGSLAGLALSGAGQAKELEPLERRFRAISEAARELGDDARG